LPESGEAPAHGAEVPRRLYIGWEEATSSPLSSSCSGLARITGTAATLTTVMTHIAATGTLDGKNGESMEKDRQRAVPDAITRGI